MDFVTDAIDYGDAPEFFVSGFSRATRISNGTARIALFVEREGPSGKIERRVVVTLVCDVEGIADGYLMFAKAVAAIDGAAPLNGRSKTRSRPGAH